jgi:hypothetical protein
MQKLLSVSQAIWRSGWKVAYYARGRGFDFSTVQTSVCNGSGCSLCIHTDIDNITHALPRNNMTYIQNTNFFRRYRLTFADWFKFRLIAKLTYEIDVWLQEKIIPPLAYVLRQLHFHIYYLFVALIY